MSNKLPTYKKLSEEDWYSIESMLSNGATEAEMAHSFDVSIEVFKKSIQKHPKGKWRFEEAKKRVETQSVINMRRIADGYTLIEREFVSTVGDYKMLDMYRDALMDALRKREYDKFMKWLLKTSTESGSFNVKTKTKEVPPDRNANMALLIASNPDLWDEKLRREKVPKVSIKVTVDGHIDKVASPRRAVKANYSVENQEEE